MSLLSHDGQGGPAHAQRAKEIRLEMRLRFFNGRIFYRPHQTVARIVDHHIQPAGFGHNALDTALHCSVIIHIHFQHRIGRGVRGTAAGSIYPMAALLQIRGADLADAG